MKHTFLVFPAGMTGVALLLLRASVSLSTINPLFSGTPPRWVWVGGCGLVACAVLAGFWTRLGALLSVVVVLLSMMVKVPLPLIEAITHILPAIVLAMTGPGSMSADARLFGRRTLHLPQ